MRRLWLLVLVVSQAAASEYAGPSACAACHPRQSSTQSISRHARALRPIADTPLATLLAAQPLRERSGISFEYRPAAEGLRVTATQGSRAATAILEWAFGAGGQAYTPVGRAGARFFEHRISWYAAAQGGRRTLGHPGAPSADPASALGIVQDADTIYRCFNCHGTNVKPGPDLRAMTPGVTCERCHGPAGEHAGKGAPMKPARLTRDGVMQLCGSCHRTSASVDDALSIRFAPVGLQASACYRKSSTLTCLTCHDPHDDASTQAVHYETKCASCHSCPTGASANCLGCHMKKSTPAPYLTFTDHHIRVY